MPRELPWSGETGKRTELTKAEAEAMLPDGEEIHTFRDTSLRGAVIMLGADVERSRLIEMIARWPCYKSGPMATGMGHGLCIQDGNDPLFVATREDKKADGTEKRAR